MENMLNDRLNWDLIKEQLELHNHYVAPDILKEDIAEKITDCMQSKVPWQIAFRQGNKDVTVTQTELRNWTPEQNAAFHKSLISQAQKEYQFYYNRYPMIDAYIQGRDPGLYLHKFTDFLNGEDFLKFARYITGDMEIRKSEPHAACYIPGNFLKLHDDFSTKKMDRRYALVFNMSKRWISDWGGLLQLVDDNRVIETVVPSFNSVSILRLPQKHQVSYVAPYATESRFTITVWLRAD
ncbi:MAG: 2OG-Fe(II) oxygenase [Emcibacter sp.]|nr:2OG-Fe(II) oxygenase [Emcibacter sp.]